MPKSPSELLSDLRATLDHNIESFGPLLYQDAETVPAPVTGSFETPLPLKARKPVSAPDPPGPASDSVDPAAETNLFGESIATAPAPAEVGSPYARIAALIPDTSPLRAFTTLEETARYVASTILIPLDETRTNPVFGVGNPHADLMVIGEAPGAEEDRQGEPFVGRAGQLLTKILQAIGFERSDVYIANILKSRPPNNRDPLPAEVDGHIPILYKQIALIQPKLLLCVGKTAGTSLLNVQSSLAKLRGTFHDYHGLPVLVTYHPAALLRNPHWKRPTWEDVQLLRARYDELGGS